MVVMVVVVVVVVSINLIQEYESITFPTVPTFLSLYLPIFILGISLLALSVDVLFSYAFVLRLHEDGGLTPKSVSELMCTDGL